MLCGLQGRGREGHQSRGAQMFPARAELRGRGAAGELHPGEDGGDRGQHRHLLRRAHLPRLHLLRAGAAAGQHQTGARNYWL